MKANELMLGDWVLDTRTKNPLRVNPFMAEMEVPAWTADCYYYGDFDKHPKVSYIDADRDYNWNLESEYYPKPCWSVGRLIEICCISMGMSGYPHTFENQVANLILMLSQAKKHMCVNFSKLEEYENNYKSK
jgi:hypothetical protein